MTTTLLTGTRGWLTTGALALVLGAAVTTQLLPTAAAAASPIRAAAADAPTVVAGPAAPAPAAEVAVAPVAALPAAAPVKKAAPKAKPAAPRPAKAAASDVCRGPGWQGKRGARALASLRHPVPAGVTVAFKPARTGYLGLTYPARGHIDMFVRSCAAESSSLLRHVMAHEMGHAYDVKTMTAAERSTYKALRGIPAGTPWFGCSYCSDFQTPAGDFAEAYAQWQRGASDSRTKIAKVATQAELTKLAALFFTS